MIITNIETVPGKNIVEHFGLVSGSTIRAKHVGRDIMASLKHTAFTGIPSAGIG